MDNAMGPSSPHHFLRLRHESLLAKPVASTGRVGPGANALTARDPSMSGAGSPSVGGVESLRECSREDEHLVPSALDLCEGGVSVSPSIIRAREMGSADMPKEKQQEERCTDSGVKTPTILQDFIPNGLLTDRTHLPGGEEGCCMPSSPSAASSSEQEEINNNTPSRSVAPIAGVPTIITTPSISTTVYAIASAASEWGGESRAVQLASTGGNRSSRRSLPTKKTPGDERGGGLSGARCCSCASPPLHQRCRSLLAQFFLLSWRNKRRCGGSSSSSSSGGGVSASEEKRHAVAEKKASLSQTLFAPFSAAAPAAAATAAGCACRSAHCGVTDTKHNNNKVPRRVKSTAVSEFMQRVLPLILFFTLLHSSPRVSTTPGGQPFFFSGSSSTGAWQSPPLLLARAQPAGFPGVSFEGHQRTAAYEQQLPQDYGQYTQQTYAYPRDAGGRQWWMQEPSSYPQEGVELQNPPPPTVPAQQQLYAPHTNAARQYADQFLSSIKEYYTGNSEGAHDGGTVPGATGRQYLNPEQQLEYATQLHLAQQQYHSRPYDRTQTENGTPHQNAAQEHYNTSYTEYSQAPYSQVPYSQAPYSQTPLSQSTYSQATYSQAPYSHGLRTTPEQQRTEQQVHIPEVQHYTGESQTPGSHLLYGTRHPQPQHHSERELQSQHPPTNYSLDVHPQQRYSAAPDAAQVVGHAWSQPYYVEEAQPRNDQGAEQVNQQHLYYTDYPQEDRRAQQRVNFPVDQSRQAYDYSEQRNNLGGQHPQGSYMQRTTDQVYMNGEPYHHPAEPSTPQPQHYGEYVYAQHQQYEPGLPERLDVHSYGQQSVGGHFNDSRRSLEQLNPQVQQSTHQGYNVAGGDSTLLQRYGEEVPYPSVEQQRLEVHYPQQHYVDTPTISEERHAVKEFSSPPVHQYIGQAETYIDENPYDEHPSAAQAATQQFYHQKPQRPADLPSVTQQQQRLQGGSVQPQLIKQQRAPQELHLSAKLSLPSRRHHEKQAVGGKSLRYENPYSESTEHDSLQQGDLRPRYRPVEEVRHRPEEQPRRRQAHRRLVRLKSQHSVVETPPASAKAEQEQQQRHDNASIQEGKLPADTPVKKYYDEEDSASEEEPAEDPRVGAELQAGTSEQQDHTTPAVPTETSDNFPLQRHLPGRDEEGDLENDQAETVQREVQQDARATLQEVSASSNNQAQQQDASPFGGDGPQRRQTEDNVVRQAPQEAEDADAPHHLSAGLQKREVEQEEGEVQQQSLPVPEILVSPPGEDDQPSPDTFDLASNPSVDEQEQSAGDEPPAPQDHVEPLSQAKGEVVDPVKDSLLRVSSSSSSLQNRPSYPGRSVARRLSDAEPLDYYSSLEQQERRHYPEVSAFPVKRNDLRGEQQNPEGALKPNSEQKPEDLAGKQPLGGSLDDVKEGQTATSNTQSVSDSDDGESTDEDSESEEEDDEQDIEEQGEPSEELNHPNPKEGQKDSEGEDDISESEEEADEVSSEDEEEEEEDDDDDEENEESELGPGDDDEQDPAPAAKGQDTTPADLDTVGKEEEGAKEPSSEAAVPPAGNGEADVQGSEAVVDKQNTVDGATDSVGEKTQKTETDSETRIPGSDTSAAEAQDTEGDLDNPRDGDDEHKEIDSEAKSRVTDPKAVNAALDARSEGDQYHHDADRVEGKVVEEEKKTQESNVGTDGQSQKQQATPLETKHEVNFSLQREEERPTDADVPLQPADQSGKGADENRDSDLADDQQGEGKRNDGHLVDQSVIDSKGLHTTNNQDTQPSQDKLTLTEGEEKAEKQRDGGSVDIKDDEEHKQHGKSENLLAEEAQLEGQEAEEQNEERAADAEGDERSTRNAPHTHVEGEKLNKEDNRGFEEEPAVGRNAQTVEHQKPVETQKEELGGGEQSQDPRPADVHEGTTALVESLDKTLLNDLVTDTGKPELAERANQQGKERETKQTLETAAEEEGNSGQHDKEPHQAKEEQTTKGLLTSEEKPDRQKQEQTTEAQTEATLATQENGNGKSVDTVKEAGVIHLSQNTSAEGQPEGLKEQESKEKKDEGAPVDTVNQTGEGVVEQAGNTTAEGDEKQPAEGLKAQESKERKEEGAPVDTVNQTGEGVVEQAENTTAQGDQGEQAREAPRQQGKEGDGGVQQEEIQAAAHVDEASSESSLSEGTKRLEEEARLTPEQGIEKARVTGADSAHDAATHVVHGTEDQHVRAASDGKEIVAEQSQNTSLNSKEEGFSGEPKSEGPENNDSLRFPHEEQIGDSSLSAGKAEEDKEQTTWLGHNGEVTENLPFDSLPSHTAGETTSPEAGPGRRESPLSWAVTDDKNITTNKEGEARKTEKAGNEEGSDSDEGGRYESISSAVPDRASPEANTTDDALGKHGGLVPGLLFHSRDPPRPVKLKAGKAAFKEGRQNEHENSTDGDRDTLSAVQPEVQRLGERDREKQPQFPNQLKSFRDKVDHDEDDALFGSNDGALDPIAYSTLPPGAAATRHKRHGHKKRTWKLTAAAKASREKSKPFREAAGLRTGESLPAQLLRGGLRSARTFDAAVTEQKSEVLEDLADKAMKRENGELDTNGRSPSNFIRRTLAYQAAKAAAEGGKEDSNPEPYLLLPRQSERIAAADVTTASGIPTDDFSAVRTIDQALHAHSLYAGERARQRQQRPAGPTVGPGPAAFLPHFIYRPPEEEPPHPTRASVLEVTNLQGISADVTSHVDEPLHVVPETPVRKPEVRPVATVAPEKPSKVVADVASHETEYEEPVSPGAALTNSRLASTLSNQTAAAEQARTVHQQRGFDFAKSGHRKQNDEGIERGEDTHRGEVTGDSIEKNTQELPVVKTAETNNHHGSVRHRGAEVQAAIKTPRTSAAFTRFSVSQAAISGPLFTVGWLLFISL